MGHALFWVESLAFGLLAVAAGVAWSARSPRAWVRWLPAGIALVPVAVGIGASVVAAFWTGGELGDPFVWSAILWTALATFGGLAILVKGLRARGEPPTRAGIDWPAPLLAAASGGALLLSIFTLLLLDLGVRQRLATLRTESGAMALAAAPMRAADADNAALVYQRAHEMITARPTPDRISPLATPKPNDGFNPEDPELLSWLESNRPIFDLLRRATALPGCSFPHDYAQPRLDWLLPELAGMRESARRLALRVRWLAARGRGAEAFADAAVMASLSRHTRSSSPMLIGYLVSVATDGLANRALEQALAAGGAPDRALADLLAVESTGFATALVRSLQLEEAFGLATFADLSEDLDGAVTREVVGFRLPLQDVGLVLFRVFLLDDDVRTYRMLMDRCQSLAPQPWHKSGTQWQDLDQWLDRTPRGLLSRLLVPALASAARRSAMAEANAALARLAIASELYRRKIGAWPGSVADLGKVTLEGEAPSAAGATSLAVLAGLGVDPFDGQPLRVKAVDGGLILYSVGPDGKDDEGATDPDDQKGDLVFRLGSAAAESR